MKTGMPPRGGRRLMVATTAAALLALSACAGAEDPAESSESTGGSAASSSQSSTPGAMAESGLLPAAEGTVTYPLTLSTWSGETVLEERPERIAVIGFSPNTDALQSLDVIPVYALTEDLLGMPWRDEAWLSKIEKVDTATRKDPINFEAIAATDPDLIVAVEAYWEEADYAKLSDIAPVLDKETEGTLTWQETQALIGETLDLTAKAEQIVTDAEAKIAETAKAHPEFAGRTITIGTDYGPQYGLAYYTSTGSTSESIMSSLGFAPNPLGADFVDDDVVPDEGIGKLDADALVVSYPDEATRKARESKALFKTLGPVVDGTYVALTAVEGEAESTTADGRTVPDPTWVLRGGASAASLPWAVDIIANQWLAGVDFS